MKTDPEKTQKAVDDDNRTMANLTPPQTASHVGADSLKASPQPPENLTTQEKGELDTLRQKPFMLTDENPTGEPKNAPKSSTNGAESGSTTKERTITKGRIIAGSVGIGGDNHPEDVKAIADKLTAMGIITPNEAAQATTDPNAMGEFVIRYQKKVFNTISDGKISAGGTTETKIIGGITTKAQTKANPQSKALSAAKSSAIKGKVPQELTPMRPPVSHLQSEITPTNPSQQHLKERFNNAGGGISPDIWRTQSPDKALSPNIRDCEGDWTNCKKVSDKMVYRHLYPSLPSNFKMADVENVRKELPQVDQYKVGAAGGGEFLPLVSEDKSGLKDVDPSNKKHKQSSFKLKDSYATAVGYASEYLGRNIPIVAGVDHTLNCSLNYGEKSTTKGYGYNEGTTDHFVVLISMGTDEAGRRYFRFLDPGTSHKSKGTYEANRLVETATGIFTCPCPYDPTKTYTMSMILPFEKDKSREGFKEIFNQNTADFNKLTNESLENKGHFEFRNPKI